MFPQKETRHAEYAENRTPSRQAWYPIFQYAKYAQSVQLPMVIFSITTRV